MGNAESSLKYGDLQAQSDAANLVINSVDIPNAMKPSKSKGMSYAINSIEAVAEAPSENLKNGLQPLTEQERRIEVKCSSRQLQMQILTV